MRQIEETNKFEIALSIKALVARALADKSIEGGDVRCSVVYEEQSGRNADIGFQSRLIQHGHCPLFGDGHIDHSRRWIDCALAKGVRVARS